MQKNGLVIGPTPQNMTTRAGHANRIDRPTPGKTGRNAIPRSTLTGTGSDPPTLSDIQLASNSHSDTGSRVKRTRYDEAGTILRITTIDDGLSSLGRQR